MDDPGTAATTLRNDAEQLYELIRAGGFWGLAPGWVPRGVYAAPTRGLLRRVALRLLAESVPREGERWW
jgi:hypothetical protein